MVSCMVEIAKTEDRVSLVPKLGLSESMLAELRRRIFAEEHETDTGPRPVWDHPGYQDKFYVIVLAELQVAIGTIYVAGPTYHTDVAWWIDSRYQSRGYGRAAVEALVPMLKDKGVTRIGALLIMGDWHASRRLAVQLKGHFA